MGGGGPDPIPIEDDEELPPKPDVQTVIRLRRAAERRRRGRESLLIEPGPSAEQAETGINTGY